MVTKSDVHELLHLIDDLSCLNTECIYVPDFGPNVKLSVKSSGAYWKEYYEMEGKRVKNIRSVSVRHNGLNQKIERLNGVFRDREKVMRGMDHKDSAQKLIDAYRIHYNFIREHGSIKKTPAEQAGIKLDMNQNKIKTLIKLASKKSS